MKILLGGVVLIFLIIPCIIDALMGTVVTVMDREHWFGFFGSYLGGSIGAIITLIGIYWQLNETKKKSEKENKEGIFEYLKYILNKNKNIEFKYQVLKDLNTVYEVRKDKLFFSLENSFIEGNAKTIFSEKKGKEIANLFESINNYNANYTNYIGNYIELEKRIDKIIQVLTKSELLSEKKDKYTQVILNGRDLILYLNMQQNLIQKYLTPGPRIYANALKNISSTINTEISKFVKILNSVEIEPTTSEEEITLAYNNIIDIENLNEDILTKDNFEKYLLKLFLFEKHILILSTLYLPNQFENPDSTIDFLKEQSEINEYFSEKIQLLNEKNKIIGKTNEIIEEIQKILNKLKE